MAAAVVHGNAKTERMMTFTADELPRSLQMYGSDPVVLAEAIRKVCGAGAVDHHPQLWLVELHRGVGVDNP